MSWTQDQILEFLELYKNETIVWDPNHRQHKNRNSVAEGWERIRDSFSLPCTVMQLKRKKESLMTTYRVHVAKRKQCSQLGEDYNTCWFAFEQMDSFLASRYDESFTSNPETTYYVEAINEDSEQQQATPSKEPAKSKDSLRQPQKRPRLRTNTSDLQESRRQLDVALSPLKNAQESAEQVEEIELFCNLLAKRIKMFEEPERDSIMWEIDQVIHGFKQRKHASQQSTSMSSPNTSQNNSSNASGSNQFNKNLKFES